MWDTLENMLHLIFNAFIINKTYLSSKCVFLIKTNYVYKFKENIEKNRSLPKKYPSLRVPVERVGGEKGQKVFCQSQEKVFYVRCVSRLFNL